MILGIVAKGFQSEVANLIPVWDSVVLRHRKIDLPDSNMFSSENNPDPAKVNNVTEIVIIKSNHIEFHV